jgi:carboxypeptidase C (cathepsin A)
MKRHTILPALSLMLFAVLSANGQQVPGSTPPVSPANAEKPVVPIPPVKASVTEHEISLGGKTIRYTATAGNLLIGGDDEQPNASVFYVAYVQSGVADPRTRPVTFLYNGGPGSASMGRWGRSA